MYYDLIVNAISITNDNRRNSSYLSDTILIFFVLVTLTLNKKFKLQQLITNY